jgi:hypothetical protein
MQSIRLGLFRFPQSQLVLPHKEHANQADPPASLLMLNIDLTWISGGSTSGSE